MTAFLSLKPVPPPPPSMALLAVFQEKYRLRSIQGCQTGTEQAVSIPVPRPPRAVAEETSTTTTESMQLDEVDPAHDLTGDTAEDLDAKARIKLLLNDALIAARATLAGVTPVLIKPRQKQSSLAMFFKTLT